MNQHVGPVCRPLVLALLAFAGLCRAQLTTGILQGRLLDARGDPETGAWVTVDGASGLSLRARSDSSGEFEFVLPYGDYLVNGTPVHVAPLLATRAGTQRERIVIRAGAFGISSLPGLMLQLEPGAVTEPLDFSGLASMRLPLISDRGFSWTDTRFTLQGINATDPYQPGRTVVFPDVQAVSDVVLRKGFDLGTAPAYGSEIALFTREPARGWHGELSSSNTSAALSSGNLLPPAARAGLQQSEYFRRFTRDHAAFGIPVRERADFFVSGTGQWASQTVPPARPREDMNSRLLFGNVRGRVQLTSRDQLDGQFSGSRINLSDWGTPAGIEALAGRRVGPSFTAPWGFAGEMETDHLDFLQLGWTRQLGTGTLQARYGFSTAHLDTNADSLAGVQSSVELVGGVVSGSPPLGNLAVRARHSLQAAVQPGAFEALGKRHRFVAGGGWEWSKARNRFGAEDDLNLLTAGGVPAVVTELNTPLDSRDSVRHSSVYAGDRVALAQWLALDVSAYADFSRGFLPSQASAAGDFAPERRFGGRGNLIAWNSLSPRVGLALALPWFRRLVLRGHYARLDGPLAGRYLDFGNANSLSGSEYRWLDSNGDGLFQPGETGQLLRRFGGAYSDIDPALKRPHANEFEIGARAELPWRSFGSIQLFRRDEKDRIAAVNTGVPPQSFTPVQIPDPGPDGISGTADDTSLTVFAQEPSTLGNDRYLLTNPKGLPMMNAGVIAQVGAVWPRVQAQAWFMAMKSRGPTNPGNSAIENDPGVVGALLGDPNSAIHAAGRSYFDRGYAGKVQLVARLPRVLGAVEWANSAVYLDGLVFGRRVLVTGLPQGPFLVAATIRGSPEGGNRAEYVLNWNTRLSRRFGRISVALDVLNVLNQNNRARESDISGPLFLERLPVAIQTPRFVRWGVGYNF